MNSIELVPESQELVIKKKKGRPRKNPIEVKDDNAEHVQPEKKKRGRKKKEKVEEEVKQKKKRGRKAALKFFSSTIRRKIPLTTVIYDNDKSILHLDIKEDEDSLKKTITYDVLKNGLNDKEILGTNITSLNLSNSRFDSDNDDDEHDETSESSEISETGEIEGDIDDDDILCEYIDNKNEHIDIQDLYEKRLESRLKQDNQLIKNLETLHNDDTLLSKLLNNVNNEVKSKSNATKTVANKNDYKKQGYLLVLGDYIESETWIDKTDVCCWWCCHKFNTIPIGLPVKYNDKLRKFQVKGVFCSFACMLAHNDKPDSKTTSMINFLYKKLTGGSENSLQEHYIEMLRRNSQLNELFDTDSKLKEEYIQSLASLVHAPLEKAPPRCTLKMFGGELDIDEFRNATKERKVYKMIEYPMYISRDYVQEVDLQNIKKANKNIFNQQSVIPSKNTLDDKKLEEVKNRMTSSSVVVTNNSIDRFIRF